MLGWELLGVVLSGVELLGVVLSGVELLGVLLLGVELIGVELSGVVLSGVEWLGVLLLGVELIGVELSGVLSLGVELLGSVPLNTELAGPVEARLVAGAVGVLGCGLMSSNEVFDRFAAKTGTARPIVAIPTSMSVTGCFMMCSFGEVGRVSVVSTQSVPRGRLVVDVGPRTSVCSQSRGTTTNVHWYITVDALKLNQ